MIAPQMTAVTTATKRQTAMALQSKQGVIYPVGERAADNADPRPLNGLNGPNILMVLLSNGLNIKN